VQPHGQLARARLGDVELEKSRLGSEFGDDDGLHDAAPLAGASWWFSHYLVLPARCLLNGL
jgi:hypothetical protein